MTIGLLRLTFHLPECGSLKEKRRVFLCLRDLLKNRFNISLVEVAEQDKWQKMVLAVVAVGTEQKAVDCSLAKIVDLAKEFDGVELLDYKLEWL